MTTTRTAGDIHTWDYQADPFGGRYRLVEQTGPDTWVVEDLAPTAEEEDRIVAHYEDCEARGFSTTPIWDRTWAECSGDQRPTIVGHKSHADEMVEEIARRTERAGQRHTIRFVSSERYAEAF
jgi:hypothetical protein